MKSNTTHFPPITPTEDLGDGTFHYNFDVVESTIEDENNGTYTSYDYEQVRLQFPITVERINAALLAEGYDHQINEI